MALGNRGLGARISCGGGMTVQTLQCPVCPERLTHLTQSNGTTVIKVERLEIPSLGLPKKRSQAATVQQLKPNKSSKTAHQFKITY